MAYELHGCIRVCHAMLAEIQSMWCQQLIILELQIREQASVPLRTEPQE
jgi:hypothetical protein